MRESQRPCITLKKKVKEELLALIETIEILNDKKLMKGIRISRDDVNAGRIHELKNIGKLDEVWD